MRAIYSEINFLCKQILCESDFLSFLQPLIHAFIMFRYFRLFCLICMWNFAQWYQFAKLPMRKNWMIAKLLNSSNHPSDSNFVIVKKNWLSKDFTDPFDYYPPFFILYTCIYALKLNSDKFKWPLMIRVINTVTTQTTAAMTTEKPLINIIQGRQPWVHQPGCYRRVAVPEAAHPALSIGGRQARVCSTACGSLPPRWSARGGRPASQFATGCSSCRRICSGCDRRRHGEHNSQWKMQHDKWKMQHDKLSKTITNVNTIYIYNSVVTTS